MIFFIQYLLIYKWPDSIRNSRGSCQGTIINIISKIRVHFGNYYKLLIPSKNLKVYLTNKSLRHSNLKVKRRLTDTHNSITSGQILRGVIKVMKWCVDLFRIAHTKYDTRLFLLWGVKLSIEVRGQVHIRGQVSGGLCCTFTAKHLDETGFVRNHHFQSLLQKLLRTLTTPLNVKLVDFQWVTLRYTVGMIMNIIVSVDTL